MTLIARRAAAHRRPLGQILADWPIWLHRMGLGRLLGTGYAIVCTTGRRSGRPRRAAVVVLRHEVAAKRLSVVAGRPDANWLRNLAAGSGCEIWIGPDRFPARHRMLTRQATAQDLMFHRTHQPFQARVQARFFGWRWGTGATDVEGLAGSLMGVAFEPASEA